MQFVYKVIINAGNQLKILLI